MKPCLVILSAPSGAGKTTIARALVASRDDIAFSVSATTRPIRGAAKDGVDYHFLSREDFDRRVENGEFLGDAVYGGQSYGTLDGEVNDIIASGRHAILDIEVQGAEIVRQRRSDVVSIFILPPTARDLVERLDGRKTESPVELGKRLRAAIGELKHAVAFDYTVTNVDVVQTVAEVASIIDSEERQSGHIGNLQKHLEELSSGLEEESARLPAE